MNKKISRLVVQITWLIFATILLLEIGVRLIWRSESTVTLFDKEISLLPKPLVSHDHLNSLKNWANSTDTYEIFDPILGWSIRPNAVVEKEGIIYSSNSIGIRSLREYEIIKPTKNITRIAAFGPSFTFGDEVKDSETWPSQMEQTCPKLEVMNWGVGGYGTDQAFLRYKTQGVNYQPDIVLIGFETNNDSRNVNRFRPFYKGVDTAKPLTKPVYVLKQDGDELVLLKNPFETIDDLHDTLLNNHNYFIETVWVGLH